MALSIKSDEADRLARQLAAATGESLTEAVEVALRERLARHQVTEDATVGARLRRLVAEVAALPVLDQRTPEQILGYDRHGLST